MGGEEETLPTSQPTATPVESSPSAEASPSATASPGTATTPGKAPEGCTASETAYVDPAGRFAFCYPVDMEIATVPAAEGPAVTIQYPVGDADRVTVSIGWGKEPWKLCIESPTIIRNERVEELSISGRVVEACFQDHYDRQNPKEFLHTTIDFRVFTAGGEQILFLAGHTGESSTRNGTPVEEILARIFESTVVH